MDNCADSGVSDRHTFLSEADCHDLVTRLTRVGTGGGFTHMALVSTWTGNIRWARNQVSASGDVLDNRITVVRSINGAWGEVGLNDTTDPALTAAVRQAERFARRSPERPNSELLLRRPLEPLEPLAPSLLFSEATYQLDAHRRAAAALALTTTAREAGMLSSGYIEVAAVGMGLMDTLGRTRYCAYTQARYSVTVRDPTGTGSGWAGVDHHDWASIDAGALTARALDKCITSQHPVRVEPGRYTTILEPQAVGDFVGQLFYGHNPMGWGFGSKIGEKVIDERITITSDPADPELGFPPFGIHRPGERGDQFLNPVYHSTTWFDHGVLVNLAYDRNSAINDRGLPNGNPNSGAFRMSGGETTIAEMIATTKRGLLVTRFDNVILCNLTSQLYRGFTRDGLWLVENGKVTHPATNLVFTESILFALNKVEALGPPQRIFHPSEPLALAPSTTNGFPQPIVVPPLKISDFSFTALSDAV
jgi:predicted Zn-dependent protease